MDYLKLYDIVEYKRLEDEKLSFPFLVQTGSGKTHYAWFAFSVTGNVNTGTFVHISKITVLQEDEKTSRSVSVSYDTPFLIDLDNRERYMEYLQQVVKLQDHFNEEEMNKMLQDYGMKPFFHAFQCVRNYIRTHTAELTVPDNRDEAEEIKATAEKLLASLSKQKNVSDETRAIIEKSIAAKKQETISGE